MVPKKYVEDPQGFLLQDMILSLNGTIWMYNRWHLKVITQPNRGFALAVRTNKMHATMGDSEDIKPIPSVSFALAATVRAGSGRQE